MATNRPKVKVKGREQGNLETVTLELAEEKGAACPHENSQAVEMAKGELQRSRSGWQGEHQQVFLCRGLGGAPLGSGDSGPDVRGGGIPTIKQYSPLKTHTAMSSYILWRSRHLFLTPDQGPHRPC